MQYILHLKFTNIFTILKGYGTLCISSCTISTILRPLWPIAWAARHTQTRSLRSTEHNAHRLQMCWLMRSYVTLAQGPRPCLVTSSHPCMCTWLFLERSLPPVSLLLPQVLLPPLPDSCHGAWRSMEDPLCNSAIGSMVSLDYVTPDTGYEPKDMELADTNELNLAASSDIYFQDILEDTVSFSNPDIDDDELAKFLAIVVDRTGQPVEVRSNSDHFLVVSETWKVLRTSFF